MSKEKSKFFPLNDVLAVITGQASLSTSGGEGKAALCQFMTDATEEQYLRNPLLIGLECQASLLSLLPKASFGELHETYAVFCDEFAELYPEASPSDPEFLAAQDEWLKKFQDIWGTAVEVKKLPQKSRLDLEKEAARCARLKQRAEKIAAKKFAAMLPCILSELLGEDQEDGQFEQ